MGRERASKTASFTYISYCDTITTQILNWSQSSESVKMWNQPMNRGLDAVHFFWCGKSNSNSSSSVSIRTRNRTTNFVMLLTLRSYKSQSSGYFDWFKVCWTQWGMLYPWFFISAHILHIVPIFILYLSFLFTTLPHWYKNTKLNHPPLSLYVMIMSWRWVQHTPSTEYTEFSIHWVQHTLSYSIHPRLFGFPSFWWKTSWHLNPVSASGMPHYTIDCHHAVFHASSDVQSPCCIPMIASLLTDILGLIS